GVERVGEINALAITTDLNHLRTTTERLIRLARVSRTSHNAAEMNRARLLRVGRVRDVVLDELPGPPARNIKEAVVERQVDISYKRGHGLEALGPRGEL